MLLIHGARSVLRSAVVAVARGEQLTGIRNWALSVQSPSNHNKATCALANKTARICYAVMRDGDAFETPGQRPDKKLNRTAFEMAD